MKTLLVFCDGTGMDGSLTLDSPVQATVKDEDKIQVTSDLQNFVTIAEVDGGSNKQCATNVLRLARSVKSVDLQGNKQIVFYQSGVGSEANFAGDPVSGTTALQALGTAVASKIRDAYVFVAQNFEDGDKICLFGFSRGAYTARKLSGLIDRIGLLSRQNLSHFFEIWRQLIDKETPTIPSDTRHPNIKCVGVWDTVGSVYKQIDALNIVDTSLPAKVEVALHAISLQENREKFLPTLWTIPQGGLQANQILKQVWFPGAHSDVGGGYEKHELADISSFWMAGEIKSLVNLDLDFLRSYSQANPDPWGTSQPHNAYMETPIILRPVVGHETRLESSQIDPEAAFHESIKYSPQQLTSPIYMITMTIIQQQFGAGFAPHYQPLNEFEKYCKDHWGTGLGASPPGVEDPGVVIPPSVEWISKPIGYVPAAAILGGQEYGGRTMRVARAPYEGGLHPGKFDNGTMYIGYDGKEIVIRDGFDMLIGAELAVRWAPVSGPFSLDKLSGAVPVRGGAEADGEPLYVAQAVVSTVSGTRPGKVKASSYALIPYAGTERTIEVYHVLVFAGGVLS